jgi:surface protein
MFDGCANISSADISQFDTSNTHSMTHMFHGCSSLTKVYLYGDLSNLNDCSDMFADIDTVGKFYYVDNVNYDLVVKQLPPSWKLCDNVIVATYTVAKDTTSATKLIGNSKLLDKISTMSINDVLLDAPIDSYTFENLSEDDDTTDFIVKMQLGCQFKELSGMFSNCKSLTNVDLSRLDASQVTSMVRMFSGCSALTSIDLLPLDTSNVTDMSYMLLGCISVETIDMSGMLFPKCKDMTRLFMSCLKLKELNMSGTQFENLNSHEMYIFYNCLSLETVDMSNMTFNVKTISNFFYSSSPLKTVSLNGFRSNATYIDDFLYQNKSIENLDVSNMYLPNAVRLRRFVTECSSLKELDFSGSYFPKITEAYQIFASCTSLTKVSNLSMPSVEDVSGMFSKCSNLQVIDLLVELNF